MAHQETADDTALPQPRHLDPHPAAKAVQPFGYTILEAGGAIIDNWTGDHLTEDLVHPPSVVRPAGGLCPTESQRWRIR